MFMKAKYLFCPQCGIRRFYVKNSRGQRIVIMVRTDFSFELVNPEDTLEGYDLDILYCLGCSWRGDKSKLVTQPH